MIEVVLNDGAARLAQAGVPDARHDAERLLTHLLDTDRGGLFLRRAEALDGEIARRYEDGIRRRAAREPLQHVIGEQEFYGLALRVDRRGLVPRFETEGLVDAALVAQPPTGARVVDLGTGSGCIAVALAVKRPDLRIVAIDLSADALALAAENATLHRVAERIRFVQADMTRLPATFGDAFDLVVSNPPYVAESEWLSLEPEVRDHDPRDALVAGPTGLELYRALAPVAARMLCPGGRLLLEVGQGQSSSVTALLSGAGLREIEVRPDPRGIPRIVSACRPGESRR